MARYTGWRRLAGDTDRPDLLDAGKRLLGLLAERRARSPELTVLTIERVMDDGSVVRAGLYGDQPSIMVKAAPAPEPVARDGRIPNGFVVTPRAGDPSTYAVDVEFPQQILAHKLGRWQTFFRSSTLLTYRDFNGSKGAYGVRFPNGLKRAGNLDWADAEGVRINYYGPARRYWYDLYRKPAAQYGRWVFLNGAALLDLQQYATDSGIDPFAEAYVVGAALVDGWLYVMQAAIADFQAPVAGVDYPTDVATWVSPPYPDGDVYLRLARYRCVSAPEKGAGCGSVVAGSHETLWAYTGRGYVNPWVFNRDASVCESFGMPDELRFVTHGDISIIRPSASDTHLHVAINKAAGTATETATVRSYTPASPVDEFEVAADYDATNTRVAMTLFLDGYTYPLPEETFVAVSGFNSQRRIEGKKLPYAHRLAMCDLREKAAVLYGAYDYDNLSPLGEPEYIQLKLRVWVDGAYYVESALLQSVAGTIGLGSVGPGTPYVAQRTGDHLSGLDATAVSPMFALLGLQVWGYPHYDTNGGTEKTTTCYTGSGADDPIDFHDSDMHVYAVGYRYTGIGSPTARYEGYIQGISSSYAGAVDADGMRTPKSFAFDAGAVMASAFIVVNRSTSSQIFTHPVCLHASTDGNLLPQLTGVTGGTLPIGTTNATTYDARYSPIWVLSRNPKLPEA